MFHHTLDSPFLLEARRINRYASDWNKDGYKTHPEATSACVCMHTSIPYSIRICFSKCNRSRLLIRAFCLMHRRQRILVTLQEPGMMGFTGGDKPLPDIPLLLKNYPCRKIASTSRVFDCV